MYEGYLVYAGNGVWSIEPENETPTMYGCGTYNITTNPAWYALYNDVTVDSVILMVLRNPETSTCTFSEKVLNAQNANAKVTAVLIVDTRTSTPWPTYMRADPASNQVALPSLFVNQAYQSILVAQAVAANSAAKAKAMYLELEFYVPNPDDRVEYDLYFNILNQKSLLFLQTYGTVARVFGPRAYFTPHWRIINGTDQCAGSGPVLSTCAANCLKSSTNQYYCIYPTDNKKSPLSGVTGVQALGEIMRQQCIFNQLSVTSNFSSCPSGVCTYNNYYAYTFWTYIDYFYANCALSGSQQRFTASCSQEGVVALNLYLRNTVKASLTVDWPTVQSCSVFDTTASANTLLDYLLLDWQTMGPLIEPFLYVNQFPFAGDVSCKSPITEDSCGILSMMCYGYATNQTDPNARYPPECLYPNNCPFGQPSCSGFQQTTTGTSGISAGAVVGIVLAFLFIAGVVGYYFHKKSQDRTRAEVDALLKQYLPMDPGATHGVAQGAAKLREQHERRLIQDMDLEDQEHETQDEV